MTASWYASVDVSADAHKVPDGPVEAAKYGLDEIRSLDAPIVEVVKREGDRIERWNVDLEDGSVQALSQTEKPPRSDMTICRPCTASNHDGCLDVGSASIGVVCSCKAADHVVLTVKREYLVRVIQTYEIPAPDGFDMETYDNDWSFDQEVCDSGNLITSEQKYIDNEELVTWVVGDPRYRED